MEKMNPLLNGADDLVRCDIENVFSMCVFTGKNYLQESQISEYGARKTSCR